MLHDGDNPSDHHPILLQVTLDIPVTRATSNPALRPKVLKWDKQTDEQKALYCENLNRNLRQSTSSSFLGCNNFHCTELNCKQRIEDEYENIITAILAADSCLSRFKPGDENLSNLKRESIETHKE
jgi:hypothetical protein